MKNSLTLMIIIIIALCSSSIQAQKINSSKVPNVVQKSFMAQFPNIANPKWEMEEVNKFEANFHQNKEEVSATFDEKGTLLETETEFKKSDLPQAVKQLLASQFAGYEVEEVEKIVFPNNSYVYEMEVEKGKEEFEIQISPEGKLIKKEVEGKD